MGHNLVTNGTWQWQFNIYLNAQTTTAPEKLFDALHKNPTKTQQKKKETFLFVLATKNFSKCCNGREGHIIARWQTLSHISVFDVDIWQI